MEKKSVYIDELTRLYNRQYLEDKQAQKVRALVAHRTPFSIAIVGIDHFKVLNDTHGHTKGDAVLREFARFLRRELRKSDVIVRYGGDEFVCVMSKTMRHDAEWIYRRIVKTCRIRRFSGLRLTVSAGVAAYPEDGKTLPRLLTVADRALNAAKRRGRDQIHLTEKKTINLPIKDLVNRTAEKQALEAALTHEREPRAAVVVHGGAGTGKTRLVKDVLNTLRGREIIWSDCVFSAEGIAYYPVREAIKYRMARGRVDMSRIVPMVYRYEVAKIVPGVSETVTEEISVRTRVVDKYRLFEGIRNFFQTGDFPQIMVIDNIQWIDPASLDAVIYLVRSLERFSFVFIHRDDEDHGASDTLVECLAHFDHIQDITLSALAESDVRECVCAILGEEPSGQLVDYVAAASRGNPLYVEEIMRALYHDHYLVMRGGIWQFKQPHGEIVAMRLEDIILRKYRNVSTKSQHVLDVASAIGWFDLELIEQVTGIEEGELVDLLNMMARFGLITYRDDRFEFTEEISRRAIYERCAEGVRGVALHKQIAEQLETRYRGEDVDRVRQLAYQYYRGHDAARGIAYCIRAGDMAQDMYAHTEAARCYTWVLELLGDDRSASAVATRIDCLYKRARVLGALGDTEAALRDLAACLRHARHYGDTKKQADILALRASLYHEAFRNKEAIVEAGKSSKFYEQINDAPGVARTCTTGAFSHLVLSEPDKAIEMFTQALRAYERAGDQCGQAAILNHIGNVYGTRGDYANASDYYERSLKMAQDAGDALSIGMASASMGIVFSNRGEYQRARASYERALAIMVEIGHRRQEAVMRAHIASVHDELGDYQAALEDDKAGLRIAREIGYRRGQATYQSNISSVYNKIGKHQDALTLYEDALEHARAIGCGRLEARILSGLGGTYFCLGDCAKSLTVLNDAEQLINTYGADREMFDNSIVFARVFLAQEEAKKAKHHIDCALKMAERFTSQGMQYYALVRLCEYGLALEEYGTVKESLNTIRALSQETLTTPKQGEVHLLNARYYMQTGKASKARTHLQRALRIFQKLQEQPNIGKVYYYRGVLEHTRGDVQKAKKNYEKAQSVFETINARGWIGKVHVHLDSLQ